MSAAQSLLARVLEALKGSVESDEKVRVRINIGGFGTAKEPVSLMAAIDTATGMLVVGGDKPLDLKDRPGWLLVSNIPMGDARVDAVFSRDSLREAITAYFELSALGLISFASGGERSRPETKIEMDGMDERGPIYRIKADCGNAQVAVLAAAWHMRIQRGIAQSLDGFDEFYGVGVDDDGDGLDAVTV